MKLFYREMGEGSPLVILHGLYGSSDNWVTIGRELAKDFRVILVDQRNHGQSPHSTQHTYPSMVDDLTELIDCLGLERINLVGHSMGGKTAMLFAHRYPHRAKSLVVIDIAPTGYDSAKTAVGSGQRDLHSRIIAALSQLDLKVATSREQLDELLAISIPPDFVNATPF
ncbi:MAG TPA: alpha/beta fold hydrolase [Tenuifilaceae bacterium]|nr:alpha/beta fold hydrolase [Tenuifilaceae bacterium]